MATKVRLSTPMTGASSGSPYQAAMASRARKRAMPSGQAIAKATEYAVSSRSEEHTSEVQSLMRISYAVFCLKTKKNPQTKYHRAAHNSETDASYQTGRSSYLELPNPPA